MPGKSPPVLNVQSILSICRILVDCVKHKSRQIIHYTWYLIIIFLCIWLLKWATAMSVELPETRQRHSLHCPYAGWKRLWNEPSSLWCRHNFAIFNSCGTTSLLKDKSNMCVSALTAAPGTASSICGAGMLEEAASGSSPLHARRCAVTGLKANPPVKGEVRCWRGLPLAAGAAEANTGPVSVRKSWSYFPSILSERSSSLNSLGRDFCLFLLLRIWLLVFQSALMLFWHYTESSALK